MKQASHKTRGFAFRAGDTGDWVSARQSDSCQAKDRAVTGQATAAIVQVVRGGDRDTVAHSFQGPLLV
jgi:hypothetical protein